MKKLKEEKKDKMKTTHLFCFILCFAICCKPVKETAKTENESTGNIPPVKVQRDSIPKQPEPKTEDKKIASKEDIAITNETITVVNKAAEKVLQRVIQSAKIDTNFLAKKVILPILDNIRTNIEEIKQKIENSNPIYEDDLLKYNELLLGYSKQIDNLNSNLDKKQDRTWLTDVIFKRSKHKIEDLTPDEEIELHRFVSDIIIFYNQEFDKNSNIRLKITIQTIGHTDTTDFIKPYEQNELVKELIKGVENKVPTTESEKREFLNKRLSLFRAKSLNNFFQEKLIALNINAEIEPIEVDMGEELPNKTYVKGIRFDKKDKEAWRRIAISNFYVLYD